MHFVLEKDVTLEKNSSHHRIKKIPTLCLSSVSLVYEATFFLRLKDFRQKNLFASLISDNPLSLFALTI